MIKFNKSTHLTIIATFAIVFIVIYLYFTITDLRKLQGEVTRLRQKVATLEENAGSASQSCPLKPPVEQQPPPAKKAETTTSAAPMVIPLSPVIKEEDDDDDSSVLTEDIKKMLDADEDEAPAMPSSSPPVNEAPIHVEEGEKSETPSIELEQPKLESEPDTEIETKVVQEPEVVTQEAPPVVVSTETPKPTTTTRGGSTRKPKTTK